VERLHLHLKVFHSLTPCSHYICGQEGCQREFHLLKTLKNHILTKHSLLLDLEVNASNTGSCRLGSTVKSSTIEPCNSSVSEVDQFAVDLDDRLDVASDSRFISATFIAKLKSHSSIPASVVDDSEFDQASSMFSGLQTQYQQMKYFKECGSYIEPVSYVVGTKLEAKTVNGTVCMVPTRVTGQHVPLRKVFKELFQLPGVLDRAVSYFTERPAGVYADFIDGTLWKEIVSNSSDNRIIIPFVLYFDDFETGNPLGSRAGVHKLGSIYACLKCFPPKVNSKLKNLFFTLLFYSHDRSEFGNNAVFSILIQEINFLRKVGIEITVSGSTYRVFFCVVQTLGDNLGLNSILGFAESFSACYFCRVCKMGKNCSSATTEDSSLLRDINSD
jgi:hypothetical protein